MFLVVDLRHLHFEGLTFATFLLFASVSMQYIVQNFLNIQENTTGYAISTIAAAILSFCFGLYIATLNVSSSYVVLAVAIGLAIPNFYYAITIWRGVKIKSASMRVSKIMMSYGLPVSLAVLTEHILNSIDRFMLAGMVNLSDAGKYGAGYDLSANSIFMAMMVLNLVAYPSIMKAYEKESIEASNVIMKKHLLNMIFIGLPMLTGLNLVIDNLAQLVIGPEFTESIIMVFPWISSAVYIMTFQVFYFNYKFQMMEKTRIIFFIGAFIAITNILFNMWLIPHFQIMGAAYATFISMVLSTFIIMLISQRYMFIAYPFKEITKVICAVLIMASSIYWMKNYSSGWFWLSAQVSLGIFIYILFCLILNVAGIRDLLREKISHRQLTM